MDEVVYALLPCPCCIRGSREPVLCSEHFGVRPSVKDRLRILGAHLGGQTSCFFLSQCSPQIALIWSEITVSWHQFRVANLFGTGTYVVPAFILLSILGLAFIRMRRFEISAFLAGTVYFMMIVTYAYVEGRFYIPVFFLLVALAVLPADWAVDQALKGRFSIWGVGVLAIFLLSCIGYPSQSGFEPTGGRSQAWDALHYANGNGKSLRYEAQQEFLRIFREAPGIVLSDIEPPYLNALLPKPFVAAPVDGNHDYCYSRIWHYGKAEAVQLVQSGLDHASPVYALLLPSKDVDQDIKRLPLIQGYSWERSNEIRYSSCNRHIDKGCLRCELRTRF